MPPEPNTMRKCEGCGKELTTKRQRRYCSPNCVQVHIATKKTEKWLATGIIEHNSKSYYMPPWVKRYLTELTSGACSVCGIDEWMGQRIPLEVDHINGDPYDDRAENLRMICPNCHAQTPSFKGGNKGSGRKRPHS